MVTVVEKIKVKEGTTIYDLKEQKDIVTKAEFKGDVIQRKLGFIYFENAGQRYRVSRTLVDFAFPQVKSHGTLTGRLTVNSVGHVILAAV